MKTCEIEPALFRAAKNVIYLQVHKLRLIWLLARLQFSQLPCQHGIWAFLKLIKVVLFPLLNHHWDDCLWEAKSAPTEPGLLQQLPTTPPEPPSLSYAATSSHLINWERNVIREGQVHAGRPSSGGVAFAFAPGVVVRLELIGKYPHSCIVRDPDRPRRVQLSANDLQHVANARGEPLCPTLVPSDFLIFIAVVSPSRVFAQWKKWASGENRISSTVEPFLR